MQTNRRSIVVFLTIIGCATAQAGGDRVDVRGMGMARTTVASAIGLDAVGVNPAHLARKDSWLTVSIAPVGVHAGSDFLTYGLYNEYFTGVEIGTERVGRYLEESDKQKILDAFRGEVGELTADGSLRLFGISMQFESVGGFAFTITDHLSGMFRIPTDFVRFVLYGNTPGSVFDFSKAKANASWLREYALSFGGTIPRPSFMDWLSLGVAVKLIEGFGHYEIEQFNTSLTTSENATLIGRISYHARLAGVDPTREGNSFSLSPFAQRAFGHGTGFDLGLAGGMGGFLTVGIAMLDLGQVNWEESIEETVADTTLIVDDPLDVQEGRIVEHALRGKKRPGTPFARSLPTTFRMGAALQVHRVVNWVPGEMLVAADFTKGLADAAGTSLYSRLSFGMEWKALHFLPLRTGISFGGTDRTNVAIGLGLHFGAFELDVATENIDLLWGGDSVTHGSFAIGTRFRF